MGIFSSKPEVPPTVRKAPVAELKRTIPTSAAPRERIITVKHAEDPDELPTPTPELPSESVPTIPLREMSPPSAIPAFPVRIVSPLEVKIAGLSVKIDSSKLIRAREEAGSEILKTIIETVIVPESEESEDNISDELGAVPATVPPNDTASLSISEPIINQYKDILETAEESYGSSEFILSDTTIASIIAKPVVESVEEPVVESVEEPVAELVVESVEEPVVESVEEPVAELVVESVEEPVVESVEETVVETEVESVEEPVAELVVEPVVESVEEPVVESVEELTEEPTEESTD